jgi:hypothetical protein
MCQVIALLVTRRTFPRNTFVIVVPAASGFHGIAVAPAANIVSRLCHVVRWEYGWVCEAWSWRDAHSDWQTWQEARELIPLHALRPTFAVRLLSTLLHLHTVKALEPSTIDLVSRVGAYLQLSCNQGDNARPVIHKAWQKHDQGQRPCPASVNPGILLRAQDRLPL